MPNYSKSYSQVAEDLLCAYYLKKTANIRYIDVGCLWPIIHSNSYFFYERGGRGVCIDPNPDVAEEYKSIRPRDAFVNCGVGLVENTLIYRRFENPVFNTFSEARTAELAAANRQGRRLVDTLAVPVRPLTSILKDAGWAEQYGNRADFLSVDVEGFELEVIQSLDFSYVRPRIVILETVVKSERSKGKQAQDLLKASAYRICGETGHDIFFIDTV